MVTVGNTVYATGSFTNARAGRCRRGHEHHAPGEPARLRHPHRRADHRPSTTRSTARAASSSPRRTARASTSAVTSPPSTASPAGTSRRSTSPPARWSPASRRPPTPPSTPSPSPAPRSTPAATSPPPAASPAPGSPPSTPTNGAVTAWAPTANNTVRGIVVDPTGTRVVLGGQFSQVNGVTADRARLGATPPAATRTRSRTASTTPATRRRLEPEDLRRRTPTRPRLRLPGRQHRGHRRLQPDHPRPGLDERLPRRPVRHLVQRHRPLQRRPHARLRDVRQLPRPEPPDLEARASR